MLWASGKLDQCVTQDEILYSKLVCEGGSIRLLLCPTSSCQFCHEAGSRPLGCFKEFDVPVQLSCKEKEPEIEPRELTTKLYNNNNCFNDYSIQIAYKGSCIQGPGISFKSFCTMNNTFILDQFDNLECNSPYKRRFIRNTGCSQITDNISIELGKCF